MITLRSLGTASSGESPAKGNYPAELVSVSDFEERPASKYKDTDPDAINIQCKIGFRFFEFPYDPDIDTKDWDGVTVYGYFTFQRKILKPNGEVEKINDSYLSKLAKAYGLLSALMGRPPTRDDEIDLESYIGVKLDIGVEPKESGWPDFTSFAKRRTARRVAETKPAPKPIPADDDLTGTAFADDDE